MLTTKLRPVKKAKVSPKWDFVPVIFANGVDDDMPGTVAAATNKRVQYGDKVYKPGEDIDIFGVHLVWAVSEVTFYPADGEQPFHVACSDHEAPKVVIHQPEEGRQFNIRNCQISMGRQKP